MAYIPKPSVNIFWWPRQAGASGGRWNEKCFVDAGCRVHVSTQFIRGGDLIFTPKPGLKTDLGALWTQLSGFGPNMILPRTKPSPKVAETFEYSDLVSVIDPNMVHELERCGIEGEALLVPNPAPPIDTSPREISGRSGTFTVLNPMGDSMMKKPERFLEAAAMVGEEAPDIRFRMVSKKSTWSKPIKWLEADNVEFLPLQPYEEMVKLYGDADLVVHFSSAEISPWTILEAWTLGKPTITGEIGLLQTIHKDRLPEAVRDFGMDGSGFDERWKGDYWTGQNDHFLHADDPKELAGLILELYTSEKRRLELSANCLGWVNNYWTCRDKGVCVLNAYKEWKKRKAAKTSN